MKKSLAEFKDKISEIRIDESGNPFRMINGKKIYQIKSDNPEVQRTNDIINRVRASGCSAWELLNAGYTR
jgi:hypothetical protein